MKKITQLLKKKLIFEISNSFPSKHKGSLCNNQGYQLRNSYKVGVGHEFVGVQGKQRSEPPPPPALKNISDYFPQVIGVPGATYTKRGWMDHNVDPSTVIRPRPSPSGYSMHQHPKW